MPKPPRMFVGAKSNRVPIIDPIARCPLLIVQTAHAQRWRVVEVDGWGEFVVVCERSSLREAQLAVKARLAGRTPRVGAARWPDVKLPSHRLEVTP